MKQLSIWQELQCCDLVLVESCGDTRAVLDISGSYSKAFVGKFGMCIGIEMQFETFNQAILNKASLLLASRDETLDYALLIEEERVFLWQRYPEELSSDELNQRLESHYLLAKYMTSLFCKSKMQNQEGIFELIKLV